MPETECYNLSSNQKMLQILGRGYWRIKGRFLVSHLLLLLLLLPKRNQIKWYSYICELSAYLFLSMSVASATPKLLMHFYLKFQKMFPLFPEGFVITESRILLVILRLSLFPHRHAYRNLYPAFNTLYWQKIAEENHYIWLVNFTAYQHLCYFKFNFYMGHPVRIESFFIYTSLANNSSRDDLNTNDYQ